MNEKFFTTNDFKVGDFVWFCNIEYFPSGRTKFNIKPTLVKIKNVTPEKIELDLQGYRFYRVPVLYYLNGCYNNINTYISKTKEGSEKKYNELLKEIIEDKYRKFKTFENFILSQFI